MITLLSKDITQFEVWLNFDLHVGESTKKSSRGDNIELVIDYDVLNDESEINGINSSIYHH